DTSLISPHLGLSRFGLSNRCARTIEASAIHCCASGTIACASLRTMTDLNELNFFVQVSQTQSFTTAARRLGVPKSTVSRAVTRLEARLGLRLIERTTRSVALTDAGELYLDRCQRVLEEAEQADL